MLLGLSGVAIGAGAIASGAYDQTQATRNSDISVAGDEDAIITLSGLGEGDVPEIGNQFSAQAMVTIAAPSDPSAAVDIGNVGNFEPAPVSFQLSPRTTKKWAISADTDPLPVEILVNIEAIATVQLIRNVAVAQAGQFDVIVNVSSTGASGALSFTARNEGSRDAAVTGIRIDDTSTDAIEVAQGDIFSLGESEYEPEPERQLISNPLAIGSSAVTTFDANDTVVIPDTGEKLTFDFDRFRNSSGRGSPNTDMRNQSVWITLTFVDGSQRQFEISDA